MQMDSNKSLFVFIINSYLVYVLFLEIIKKNIHKVNFLLK